MVNLKELSKMVDKAFKRESKESLKLWLLNYRLDVLIEFIQEEIIERRDYSASKAYKIVLDKIKELKKITL